MSRYQILQQSCIGELGLGNVIQVEEMHSLQLMLLPVARITNDGISILWEELPKRDSKRILEVKSEFDEKVALVKFFLA